jgi:hypothetical protein
VTAWDDGPGVVELPDGRRVRGRGLRRPLPAGPEPDFAVVLLGKDPGPFPWPHRWVRWGDFRNPASPEDALAALTEAHARAVEERVEVACGGGIGRTGTALAILAGFGSARPDEAVAWVRRHYHPRAAETPWQRRWVLEVGRAHRAGGSAPSEP